MCCGQRRVCSVRRHTEVKHGWMCLSVKFTAFVCILCTPISKYFKPIKVRFMTLDSPIHCIILPYKLHHAKKGMIAHIVHTFILFFFTASFHIFMRGCFIVRYNILSSTIFQHSYRLVGGTFVCNFVTMSILSLLKWLSWYYNIWYKC